MFLGRIDSPLRIYLHLLALARGRRPCLNRRNYSAVAAPVLAVYQYNTGGLAAGGRRSTDESRSDIDIFLSSRATESPRRRFSFWF